MPHSSIPYHALGVMLAAVEAAIDQTRSQDIQFDLLPASIATPAECAALAQRLHGYVLSDLTGSARDRCLSVMTSCLAAIRNIAGDVSISGIATGYYLARGRITGRGNQSAWTADDLQRWRDARRATTKAAAKTLLVSHPYYCRMEAGTALISGWIALSCECADLYA